MSSEDFRISLNMPVSIPIPFDPRNMLSINPYGAKTANETYVPEHDILNVIPGAFVGMCNLIQHVDTYTSTQTLQISEEEMQKAVMAMRYILSREGLSHTTIEEAYIASGFVNASWQARTWVLKNLADVMLRIWHQAGTLRVNNVKQYMDSPINNAAEAALRSIGKSLE